MTARPSDRRGCASRTRHHVGVHFGREAVAAAPMRLDQRRILRIGLDLLAQPADLVVDAAVEHIGGAARRSGRAADRGSAPCPACSRKTHSSRNSAVLSGTATPSSPTSSRRPTSSVQRSKRSAFACSAAALRRQAVGAPQHRLDARQQFARIERLGQVVVGAHLQPDDAVGLLRQRGQQDDRQVGGRRAGAGTATGRPRPAS